MCNNIINNYIKFGLKFNNTANNVHWFEYLFLLVDGNISNILYKKKECHWLKDNETKEMHLHCPHSVIKHLTSRPKLHNNHTNAVERRSWLELIILYPGAWKGVTNITRPLENSPGHRAGMSSTSFSSTCPENITFIRKLVKAIFCDFFIFLFSGQFLSRINSATNLHFCVCT